MVIIYVDAYTFFIVLYSCSWPVPQMLNAEILHISENVETDMRYPYLITVMFNYI